MDSSQYQNDAIMTEQVELETLDKDALREYYLKEYTSENRLGFCKLARRKYRFENYKLSTRYEDIEPEDFIVQTVSTLTKIDKILQKNQCSVEDFTDVFNDLSVDQINYIGF